MYIYGTIILYYYVLWMHKTASARIPPRTVLCRQYLRRMANIPPSIRNNMIMKRILILLLCLLILPLPSIAEDAAADLQARFGDQASFTHNGTDYMVKKRTSTLLFAAQDEGELLLSYIVAVDDDLDRIALISVPTETMIPADGGQTLAQIYASALPPQEQELPSAEYKSIALLDAINTLFPEALIESRLVLDTAGLDLLDGGTNPDPALSGADNLKARLKAIYHAAEGLSSSDQMNMFDSLAAYLATDVKTGAMMKIADKAQRYEIPPTIPLPGSVPDEQSAFITNEAAITELAIEYFYEQSPW